MSESLRHPSKEELLLASDGELSEAEAKQIEAHLKACWVCRGLKHDMDAAIALFISVLDNRIPPSGRSRALLTARLSTYAFRSRHWHNHDGRECF